MKPTPTERAALAAARALTPMPPEDAAALATAPDLRYFARRHDRVRLAQTRLAEAAAAWRRRELRLSLYRQALRRGDRTDAFRERVTAIDTPTARIRTALVTAHRALVDADRAAFEFF
jgi:hypothetical protein